MKVFYVYATNDKGINQARHNDLIQFLKSGGNLVDTYAYVITDNIERNFEDKDSTEIIKAIKNVDVFIGEMGKASQTLGFLLAFAVQNMKPSLYLYPSSYLGRPGKIITENPSRLITVEDYNCDNYQNKVTRFLSRAKKQMQTTRTTFVSTTQIDNFINQETKKTGQSKGEVIRRILEDAVVSTS
jgi:hypothetical protein